MTRNHDTFLAAQASRILEAATAAEHGILVRVTANVITPALRGRQVLYRFRQETSPANDALRIDIMGENELWIIKT